METFPIIKGIIAIDMKNEALVYSELDAITQEVSQINTIKSFESQSGPISFVFDFDDNLDVHEANQGQSPLSP